MLTCHLHYCAQPCESCAAEAFLRKVFPSVARTTSSPAVITFKEAVYDNMFHPWEKPHAISDPGQLREECTKRGVYSHQLRDSLIWKSRPPTWF